MAETASHLLDHAFPRLPVRHWVLSLPKRLRYFLQREPAAVMQCCIFSCASSRGRCERTVQVRGVGHASAR
jgi:hypothetical protein